MSNKPKYTINLGKDKDGKRITKTFYADSKREAKRKAEEYRVNLNNKYSTDTLNGIANRYLETITDTTKKHRIRQITDRLGDKPIAEINPADIEDVLIMFTNISQRTMTRYLQALNQVFTYALANRLITYNPCPFVRLPQCNPPKERNALKMEEIAIIEHSDCDGTFPALIMIYCGLRRGELTVLTWGDIDFKNATMTINKAYDYKNEKTKGTKSSAGNRVVPIPNAILPRLEEASKGKKKTAFVINKDGKMFSESNWQYALKHLKNETGLDYTWHCFRHTYATLLYSADIGVKEAQTLLGHSSAKVTMDIYTHLDKQKQLEAADKINKFADRLQTASAENVDIQ